MPRTKIKVSELPSATTIDGLHTLGVDNTNKSVKVPIALLKGNQGDAFTYDDFTPTQIANLKGATGKSAYQFAVDGGYEGTEEQFNNGLSSVEDKVKLTPQELTTKQQAQVNTNIGTQAIADMAAKQLFVDMWTSAHRSLTYDQTTGLFGFSYIYVDYDEVNKPGAITDITYEEALQLYGVGINTVGANLNARYINMAFRNYTPLFGWYLYGKEVQYEYAYNIGALGVNRGVCELIVLDIDGYGKASKRIKAGYGRLIFGYQNKLKEIRGGITFNERFYDAISPFLGCVALEDVKIFKLDYSMDMKDCALLSHRAILYMIDNALTKTLIITLHPDAYARAIADPKILAALTAKPNITLASA